jgi:hypothetical protein
MGMLFPDFAGRSSMVVSMPPFISRTATAILVLERIITPSSTACPPISHFFTLHASISIGFHKCKKDGMNPSKL